MPSWVDAVNGGLSAPSAMGGRRNSVGHCKAASAPPISRSSGDPCRAIASRGTSRRAIPATRNKSAVSASMLIGAEPARVVAWSTARFIHTDVRVAG